MLYFNLMGNLPFSGAFWVVEGGPGVRNYCFPFRQEVRFRIEETRHSIPWRKLRLIENDYHRALGVVATDGLEEWRINCLSWRICSNNDDKWELV